MQAHIPHGHYYTTFYVLAILTLVLGALIEGWRRNFPLRPWLVLLAGYLLAFIVGTKLITMPLAAWGPLLREGHWPLEPARSVLGGSLLGSLALLALHRWLGLGRQVFDALAWPLSAALAVQCVGCLLTGCCFGEVSGAGLVYAAGTPPWWAQVAAGLIPATAPAALPVLPTQLLALLLCAGTAATLWLTRHRHWPAGSWALLSAGLLLLGRGLLESWRDPAGEPVGAQMLQLGGVRLLAVQWVLLPVGLLALAAWAWYKGRAVATEAPAPAGQPTRHLLVLTGLLLVAALLGPGALVLPEVLVIKALLLAVLAMEAGAWLLQAQPLPNGGSPAWLRAPLGLVAIVLLLTSQTMPADSSANQGKDLTITVGARQTTYDDADNTGCGEPPEVYNHRTYVVSAEAAYRFNEKTSGAVNTVGLGVSGGTDRIGVDTRDDYGSTTTYSPDTTLRQALYSINLFMAGERTGPGRREFGYRVGLHVGQLANTPSTDAGVNGLSHLAPDLMFWYGRRQKFFGQADAGYGLHAAAPYTMRLGIGSGFGFSRGHLLAGIAGMPFTPTFYHSSTLGFASARIYLPNTGFSIEPYAASNFDHYHQVSLRLHYCLALKNSNK
ncbi:prolipoprotein diacylglyceryl transferase [Hymenobacter sp. ASUV-10]|uniref:Prolipoprotein diacylglyceryl transferase n=1 Tax=Hymenobacter aranciens TaxID=3063996 RepID=A0ABT9BDN5_9BACT|nr:prolipoprotein diacylglyceryl transferase family protein [Hymenobacter sp. ASUV-10]MDO7876374.1 prolipoprotein diacylglyceryl transferase [Hymenobacter sp. ASUV-10]